MFLVQVFTLTVLIYYVSSKEVEHFSKYWPLFKIPRIASDRSRIDEAEPQKVKVQLYYECLCPYSRDFAIEKFVPTLQKLNDYLDIFTYPFGKAKIIKHKDGSVNFKCQHGPQECYGNKLHACAINILGDITRGMEYNACMMGDRFNRGSDDDAADQCGKAMKIDPEPIKSCAKGEKGTQLLINYGEESSKAGFHFVPYVLINGKEFRVDLEEKFFETVCSFFKSPPPPCK